MPLYKELVRPHLEYAGFPPGMFERGCPKEVVSGGPPPEEKNSPILTGMSAKYGKYFFFLCQQGEDYPPFGAEWGVQTPPGPPLAETLI